MAGHQIQEGRGGGGARPSGGGRGYSHYRDSSTENSTDQFLLNCFFGFL